MGKAEDEKGMMNLLLINPGNSAKMYQELASPLRGIEPPFWAGLIATFIREHGYSVAILDADADNLSPKETAERVAEVKPRLAVIVVQGVSPSASSTPKMMAAIDLVKELKNRVPHVKTLVGGLHPSSLPERTLRETGADLVCQGEGFYTILGLLNLKEKTTPNGLWLADQVGPTRRAPLLPAEELPPVAWDLLDMTKYRAHNWHCLDDIDHRQPYGVIYTSLGCPYDCHFCQVKQLYSGKPGIRFRNPEGVAKELDILVNKYGIRHIKIMDELFAISEKRVASVCDPIIERGYDLNMWAYARVDTVTKPMLEKMKQAGINWIAYGIESASELSLEGVGKHFSRAVVDRAVQATKEAGINICGHLMFGLPDDNLESMQASFDMICKYNFDWVNLYCTMAYPGSKLYEDAIKEGTPLPETWDGYSQLGYDSLPLSTKYLTSAEVVHFRDKAFQEYYSNPTYLEMIGKKFGTKARASIKQMLQRKLRRRYQ